MVLVGNYVVGGGREVIKGSVTCQRKKVTWSAVNVNKTHTQMSR